MKNSLIALGLTFGSLGLGITWGVPPDAEAGTLGFSLSNRQENDSITVLDELTEKPLTAARISLTPSSDPTARNLTITHDGYASVTLLGVKSRQVTVYLRPLPAAGALRIAQGTTTGWNTRPGSGMVYLGTVIRSLSASDLLQFDLNSVISPLKDRIDIWGSHDIPSNIVLPEQDVTMFFRRFHLNKPEYRLPLEPSSSGLLVSSQGEMTSGDFKNVGMGGVSLDAVNKINFTRIAVGLGPELRADFDLAPVHQVVASQAPFDGQIFMAAVTDLNGDRETLIPTDIKAVQAVSRPVTLKSTPSPIGRTRGVITLAMTKDNRRLSGIVNADVQQDVHPGAFLPVGEPSDYRTFPSSIRISAGNAGLSGAVLLANFPEEDIPNRTVPVGYIYGLPSSGDSTVTVDPALQLTGYSLFQLQFGPGFSETEIDGKTALQGLQRFTRVTSRQAGSH